MRAGASPGGRLDNLNLKMLHCGTISLYNMNIRLHGGTGRAQSARVLAKPSFPLQWMRLLDTIHNCTPLSQLVTYVTLGLSAPETPRNARLMSP
jgi:hypothetical protein